MDIAALVEIEILRVFCQTVEVRRQDVAAQGQFIGDFLEGEILFIARFNQVTPVGDALARRHIEDDAGLPAGRMGSPVEIEIAFIEEDKYLPFGSKVIGIGLLFRQV